MCRLIYYELAKIWRKRSFVLSVCVLLILNLFLLWYVNCSNGENVPLSAYKSFQNEITEMSETEKADYISNLKETMDGVCLVQNVLDMQKMQGKSGKTLVKQEMTANPGVFEKYYKTYQDGSYLHFTDSIWQEKNFIDELYDEQQKVAGYNEYLQSVQGNKVNLSSISIFGNQNEESFATRNIEKSAEDYATLSDQNIRWMPSKALSVSMESIWTDLFLILSVFLFTGNLIFEEKEKKLFYITRSTKRGQFQSICAKLAALLIHCVAIAVLLYGCNLIFAEVTIGFGDVTTSIQSIAAYMESNLNISILGYIIGSVLAKSVVLFGTGVLLTALCILTDQMFFPYLTGMLLYGGSYLLYLLIPAVGKGSVFKYVNLIGLMKTENLYGGYLNFDIGGYPISRLAVSWSVIIMFAVFGIVASILLFLYGTNFELSKRQPKHQRQFHPHASLLSYESYKILIMNRALVILLLFGLVISGRILNQKYNPSVQEQYYQELMMQLEGELTEQKEDLILSEQERYTQAFSEIEKIDGMVSNGEIDESTGEQLKADWYGVTFFYPSFQRVMQQYERIQEKGEDFIYDTGYLYFFGRMNDDYLIDLLLLSLCIIIAFGNVMAMEFQSGSWYLLSATKQGKKKIIGRKVMVGVIVAMVISVLPIICRFMNVSAVYPLHELTTTITDIPCYQAFPLTIPIWLFVLLLFFAQMASMIAVVIVVLFISYWRKNYIQTVFFAILILVVPLVLKLLGFAFAGWGSVYPLYSWTALK